MTRVTTPRRELFVAAGLSAVGAALLLFEALFLGRCTRAFTSDDPRIDLRPWARAASGPLEPINMIAPDVDGFVLPGLMRARQQQSPWWDRCQLLGYPLAANIPFPFFSPVAWLFWPLDPMAAIDWMLWLHFAVAGFLAYRACRALGASPPAAALGAIGFTLSAWMYTRWRVPHEVYTMAWWPGQLMVLEWLRRGAARRALLEGVLFTALMMLSGFPQTALVLTAGTVVLGLTDRQLWTGRARALMTLTSAVVLGGIVAWPQLRIAGEAYRLSIRAGEKTLEATALRGLRPAALMGGMLPEFFGQPADFSLDPPARTMEDWLPHRRWLGSEIQNSIYYNAFYPGMLLVLLLPVMAGAGGLVRRMMLCSLVALIGCLLSPLLMSSLPWARSLATGNVKRLLVLVDACWPIAGALTLQHLFERRGRLPWKTTLLVIVALAILPPLAARLDDPDAGRFALTLVHQVSRQAVFAVASFVALLVAVRASAWTRWLPAIVLLADLALLSRSYNPLPREQEHYPSTPALEVLRSRPGRMVVFGVGPNLAPPSIVAVLGIRSVQGAAPMVPARTAELLSCIEGPLFDERDPRVAMPLTRVRSLSHPLLDLLEVDTVVHADPALASESGLPVLFESPEERLGLLARPTAGPRAFLCGGAQVVTDKNERLRRLADLHFDGHRTVLVEQPLPFPLPATGEMQRLEDSSPTDTRHELVVDAKGPGLVVLTEAWDPGWLATVDGERATVFVADHALMAVAVGEGYHTVEFHYAPEGLALAVTVALVALGIVVVAARRLPSVTPPRS